MMQTALAPKRTPKHPTWEHPKGSGIKIAQMPNVSGGKVYGYSFQVRIPAELLGTVGKREMFQRPTREEAERLAEDRLTALKKHGTSFAQIPPDGQRLAAMAWSLLSEHNKGAAAPLGLLEVVKAGIRTLSPAGGRRTVAEVIAELTESKQARHLAGGLDATTLHDFKVRGARVVAEFGASVIGEIAHPEIERWLRKMAKEGAQFGGPLSARSVRNYRNTLSEVFRHATAKQYCAANPFERFTREDMKNLGGESADRGLDGINILSVPETRKLLAAAQASEEPGMLASVVLRLFCGVRTAEVCRLDWSEVRWSDSRPYLHIPAGKAKKRRIRHVDIPANALAWLSLCSPPAEGKIVAGVDDAKKGAKAYCERFGRVAKAAGIGRADASGDWKSEWESNDTRHSFGSYHFALHGDSVRTAGQLGHRQGDEVLFAHYRSLVRKEDAEAFFGLRPETSGEQVLTFPQAAGA